MLNMTNEPSIISFDQIEKLKKKKKHFDLPSKDDGDDLDVDTDEK